MQKIRRVQKISIKRGVVDVFVAAIIMVWPAQILAATAAAHVVISEVQTGASSDASKEFVELYNPTNAVVSLENWTMEYASSSGTTWAKKATLHGAIMPFGFYLLSTANYVAADVTMSSGLAAAGGHVRIKDAGGGVIDLAGWGSATHPEGKAIDAPVAGGSIERLPGRLSDQAGNSQDTDDNSLDFVQREVAEPQSSLAVTEDPSLVSPTDEGTITPPSYLPIYVTELLPDPASPLTDAKDEFIELYNPNSEPVDLNGYVLRAGSGFKNFYTISDVSIAAGAYLPLYSADTNLALANSGSAVQILDPLGHILDQTDFYGTAKTGEAWARINGAWTWTLEATPGSANVLSSPASDVSSVPTAATAPKSSAKKTTTKKSAAKKAASKTTIKTSKTSSKKASKKSPKVGIAATTTAIAEPSPLARWLLIAAGCFTIGYAIYGFRHDIYNYYIKSRRNAGTWLASRAALPWRRNNRAD